MPLSRAGEQLSISSSVAVLRVPRHASALITSSLLLSPSCSRPGSKGSSPPSGKAGYKRCQPRGGLPGEVSPFPELPPHRDIMPPLCWTGSFLVASEIPSPLPPSTPALHPFPPPQAIQRADAVYGDSKTEDSRRGHLPLHSSGLGEVDRLQPPQHPRPLPSRRRPGPPLLCTVRHSAARTDRGVHTQHRHPSPASSPL